MVQKVCANTLFCNSIGFCIGKISTLMTLSPRNILSATKPEIIQFSLKFKFLSFYELILKFLITKYDPKNKNILAQLLMNVVGKPK